MGEEQLLELAKQFLQTPEGQKVLADQIDVNSLEKKLLELESSNLTREQRKQNRQNKRTRRRGERKAQIEALKERLKDQVPQIRSYKIVGRLYDKQTGQPIKGANITGTQLNIPGRNPKTNSQGEFEIEVRVAVLPFNNKVLAAGSGPFLTYTKSGYAPSTQNILNLDRTVKSNLSTFSLLNIDVAAQQAKAEVQNTIDEGKSALNSIYLNGVEILIVAKRKSIMKVVDVIKTRLVPLAIGMLIAFGITKLSQKSQKTCPSPNQLRDVIRRRNSVVKQLNQIFRAVTLNTALAVAFLAISKVIRGARITIDNLPIPLIFTPYTLVGQLQNVNDLLEKLEQDNKDLSKQVLISLVFLIVALTIILLLLKGIDNLIQECSEEKNIPFEEISEELLDLTQEAEEEGTSVVTNINGFILSVETAKNTVGDLKRRQAIAKNVDGVTLLKGEPSFASSDQILIDELVFYIQQNNLKAN